MKKKYDVLALDLGNVLVGVEEELTVNALADISGKSYETVYSAIVHTGLFRKFNMGHISPAEFRRELSKHLGISVPDETFDKAYRALLVDLPQTSELVKKLSGRYDLYLFSNTDKIHFEYCLARYEWLSLFKAHHLSYEVNSMKPEIAYYEAALQVYSLIPSSCAFFDDKPENIEGALRAGIPSFWVEGGGLQEKFLVELGIL